MSGRVGKCLNDDGKCREMSGNVGISSGGGPISCSPGEVHPIALGGERFFDHPV